MTTYLSLEYTHAEQLPAGYTNEVRTPDTLVERFLEVYTDPGDRVVDIFAGFGTTLRVAERLGRVPYGIEYESDRVAHAQEHIPRPDHCRQGDVLEMDLSWLPVCDCCFTSPPFMVQTDERNPFRNYAGESTYEDYLENIVTAFSRLNSVLATDGHLLIDVVNMKYEGRVTPLAWDVAKRVSNVFHFDGEVVITWENNGAGASRDGNYGYGYDHSYCLVFTKTS